MPDISPKTLISIVGPTGAGKTALSLRLAQRWQTEIISCDSCQFYQFMDIGTAKITAAERQEIPHHFLDFLLPDTDYNAGQFETAANTCIETLFAQHDKVIMAGGSTLYAHAVWHGLNEMPAILPEIREALNQSFRTNGLAPLLEELQKIDPETYQIIDRQNPIRVIRALEVYRSAGNPISFYRNRETKKPFYHSLKIGLTLERAQLYERINARVLQMIAQGLVAEVENLLSLGYNANLPAMQAIGYKETTEYLNGQIHYEEMIEKIRQHSRNYAKRQLTFFRREKDLHWLDAAATTEDLADAIAALGEKFLNDFGR